MHLSGTTFSESLWDFFLLFYHSTGENHESDHSQIKSNQITFIVTLCLGE